MVLKDIWIGQLQFFVDNALCKVPGNSQFRLKEIYEKDERKKEKTKCIEVLRDFNGNKTLRAPLTPSSHYVAT